MTSTNTEQEQRTLHEPAALLAGPPVAVRPVQSSADMEAFWAVPHILHSHEPLWVPTLCMAEKDNLHTGKNPFWHKAKRELFIAWRDKSPVGRVVAIVDNALSQRLGQNVGGWGFWECENSIATAAALFNTVQTWHSQYGETAFLRGPLNPSLNYICGMMVEGFDAHPPFLMPWNPTYYPQLLAGCGMSKEKDLLCFRALPNVILGKKLVSSSRSLPQGDTVRISNVLSFARDVDILCDLYNDFLHENWGFTPVSADEMRFTLKELRYMPFLYHLLFYEREGRPVAVIMMIKDISGFLKSMGGRISWATPWHLWRARHTLCGLRFLLVGVRQEFHNTRVLYKFMTHAVESLLQYKEKVQYVDFGWTLEENRRVHGLCEYLGASQITRHRIYRKELQNGHSVSHLGTL